MICKYSNRDKESDDRGWYKLYCSITSKMCHCQYPCDKINNWRNMDNLDKRCVYFKREGDKEYMSQGKYKVLYEKRGMLYIELDSNTSIVVCNPYEKEIPKGVDLIKIRDEYYIKGFEPNTVKDIEVSLPYNDTSKEVLIAKPKKSKSKIEAE